MAHSQEQLGSIPSDDIKDFASLLDPLKREQAENLFFDEASFCKVQQSLPSDFSWSVLYELSVNEFMIFQMAVAGCLEEFDQVRNNGGDILRYMLDKSASVIEADKFEWDGGHQGQFHFEDLLATAYAMRAVIDSLRFYGRYINRMVADVREGRDPEDGIFFDVLRLDPTAIGCPSFVSRLSRAYMQGDDAFMGKLQAALAGGPHATLETHGDLRLVLQLVHEAEALEGMRPKLAEELFINELKLYTSQGDAKRSLMKFIQRWVENQRCDMKS